MNLSTVPRKAVTLRDVAQAIGMSDFTVSCALNNKGGVAQATRRIVLEAARELGYTPNPHAQRLANGLANNHVDIVSLRLDWGMGARKARWIQSLLLERGYTAPIHAYKMQRDAPKAGRDFIAALCRQRPRAIVLDSHATQEAEFEELQRYRAEGGIVICYGYQGDQNVGEFDRVLFDGRHSTCLAIEHLIALGHQDIGFYYPGTVATGRWVSAVFQRSLEEHGLSAREEWVFSAPEEAENSEPEEIGGLMAEHFLSLSRRPTGVFIFNDYAALRFIAGVFHSGVRVPHELSVVGHDNRPLAQHAMVPLSSITHPVEEMAQMVVQLLDERLTQNGAAPPQQVVIRGEIKARGTSTAPEIAATA